MSLPTRSLDTMADTSHFERTPISVRAHGGDPQVDSRVESSLSMLAAAFDGLRELYDLPQAELLEFVIAKHLSEAVRDEAGRTVGVEDLSRYELERLGGVVVGKTMFRDDAHRHIVIVLDAAIFETIEPSARALELYLVSHELAHGLIGQLRSAGRPAMAPTNLPWKASHWLARYALEEYLADSLAEIVLRQLGHVTDAAGEAHPLSIRVVFPRSPAFVDAALVQLTQTGDRIHQYRLDGQLESMWGDVQAATSRILITLAHAQAEVDEPTGRPAAPVTSVRVREFGPLHDCWDAMHQLFASFPLLCTRKRFAELEPQVLEEAGSLVLQLWRELGLTFRPEADSFHIAVAAPHRAWPRTAR